MTKLEPFYIYAVFGEDGEMKHSGISYGEIDTKSPPTQAELREALLISATFAEDEYQWPAHSQPDGKQLNIKLYGPFVDRKSVVTGKRVSVSVDTGGLRNFKQKIQIYE